MYKIILFQLFLIILILNLKYHTSENFDNKSSQLGFNDKLKINEIDINNELYIMTVATENYSNNLLNSLNTIKISNPFIIVNVYCINWSDNKLNEFIKIFPKYKFINYKDNYIKEKLKNNEKSGYVIKLKVELIYQSFIKNKKNLLFFDADTKIMNKIHPLLEKYKNNDILITYRPKAKERSLFASGVMGFTYNRNTQYFLKQYNYNTFNNITNKEDYHPRTIDGWWHDQIGFLKTYKQFPNIKYYFFTETEHNLSGKHNPKQKKLDYAIFQSY